MALPQLLPACEQTDSLPEPPNQHIQSGQQLDRTVFTRLRRREREREKTETDRETQRERQREREIQKDR